MKIQLPEKVQTIIATLETAGYEAFAVGGCVRDSIFGRTPNDWDITTSAKPEQVKALFRRTVDTGIQHGTVTVLIDKEGYEVTTYRIDGEYKDSRHPSSVSFTENLAEDLCRRDFTINAMAYNERCGLVDIFGGEEDLTKGVIRCVGDAEERFTEDALRILRAVRFAAQLGFCVEEKTYAAAAKLAQNLKNISAERIQTELVKLLVSPYPQMLKNAYEMGITAVVLPEFDEIMHTPQNNPHHMYNVGEHTLKALEFTEPDKCLRLAALCHDFGKAKTRTTKKGIDHFYGHPEVSEKMAAAMLRRLKFDNDTIGKVKKLVALHDVRPHVEEKDLKALLKGERIVTDFYVRKLIYMTGKDLFPQLMQLCGADILAQSDYHKMQKLLILEQVHDIYEEVIERGDCLSLKELAVNGKDLLEAGTAPGKQIGEILDRMLKDVLEHPEHNTKEYLMNDMMHLKSGQS